MDQIPNILDGLNFKYTKWIRLQIYQMDQISNILDGFDYKEQIFKTDKVVI